LAVALILGLVVGEKMKRAVNLGKVFGIPVRLHYTWFLALVFIVAALAYYFRGIYPLWQDITLGIAASLLFFASMCARELAHSFIAINRGMSVKSVTLYVFGGVPRITEQDTRPIPELLVAVAGPLSSLIIAGIFYALQYAFAGVETSMLADLMLWLFYFNIMMTLFNIIPGFPLDGGRGLRAILWMISGNYNRTTRIANLIGSIMGFLIILGGILAIIITRAWFNGLALAAIGWFLADAAAASHHQALVREVLRGVTARYMMTESYTPIKQQLDVGLVRNYVIDSGKHYFLVVENGKLLGMVTIKDITKIPRGRWGSTQISEIMTPAAKLKTAHPEQPAVDLLEQMDDYNINQIPILENSKLLGVVARDSLIRFLMTRAKLRA
jgi:Zn-dependent protease/predicted transcriptional regulator